MTEPNGKNIGKEPNESSSPPVGCEVKQNENSWSRWIDGPTLIVLLTATFYFGGRIYIEHYYSFLGLPIDLYNEDFRLIVGEGGIELTLFVVFLLLVVSVVFVLLELANHKFLKAKTKIKEPSETPSFGNSIKYLRFLLLSIILLLFMFSYWKYSSHIGNKAARDLMIRLQDNCEGYLATVFTLEKGQILQRTGFLFSGFGKFIVLMTPNEKILIPLKSVQQIILLKNNAAVCKDITKGFSNLK